MTNPTNGDFSLLAGLVNEYKAANEQQEQQTYKANALYPTFGEEQGGVYPAGANPLYPQSTLSQAPPRPDYTDALPTYPAFPVSTYPSPQLGQFVDPTQFRNPSHRSFNAPYEIPALVIHSTGISTFSINQLFGQLAPLLNPLNELVRQRTPFNPAMTENNPVHKQLNEVAVAISSYYAAHPANKRVVLIKRALEKMIRDLSELKPSADYSVINDNKIVYVELLEIALRNHLFELALKKHNEEIADCISAKKFPDDLKEREEALYKFGSKDGLYLNLPLGPAIYQQLVDEGKSDAIIQTFITSILKHAPKKVDLETDIRAYEQGLAKELEKQNIGASSVLAKGIESDVRNHFISGLLEDYVHKFQEDFTQTASLTFKDLTTAAESLKMFLGRNETLPLPFEPEAALIAQIFDLGADEPEKGPFSTVLEQIAADQTNAHIVLSKTSASQPYELPRYLSKLNKPLKRLNSKVKEYREGPAVTKESIDAFAAKRTKLVEAAKARYLILTGAANYPSAPPMTGSVIVDDSNATPAPAVTPIEPVSQPATPAPVQPAVQLQAPAPTAPAAVAPVVQRSRTYTAIDFDIPLISYTNIVFPNLFQPGDEERSWKSLPKVIQLDVLRHISWGCKGRAEDFVRTRFGKDLIRINEKIGKLEQRLPKLERVDGVSDEFVRKAEEFLAFYYSDIKDRYGYFSDKIKQVPLEPVFLRYVWEMAKEANVEIAEWDYDFAKNNFNKIGMVALSVQALERRLHTQE